MYWTRYKAWVESHDWFVRWERDEQGELVPVVQERYFDGQDVYHEYEMRFEDSFEDLRAWAGY